MISKKVFFWVINIIIIIAAILIIKIKFFPTLLSEPFVHSSCAISVGVDNIWLADYTQYVYQFDQKGKVINKFQAGANPSSVIAFAGYLACTQDQALSVIRTSDSTVNAIQVGTRPVASTWDGANVWVANQNSDNISVVDDVLWKNINTFTVGYTPSSLAFDGTYIWVALTREGKVALINRGNYNISKLPVGGSGNLPMKVCADPSKKFVFVLNSTSTLQKLTINGVEDTIDLPESQYTSVASDGKTAYVGDVAGILRFFDIATGKMTLDPISFGGIISDIAVDSTYVYVFSNSSTIFKSYNKTSGDLAINFNL